MEVITPKCYCMCWLDTSLVWIYTVFFFFLCGSYFSVDNSYTFCKYLKRRSGGHGYDKYHVHKSGSFLTIYCVSKMQQESFKIQDKIITPLYSTLQWLSSLLIMKSIVLSAISKALNILWSATNFDSSLPLPTVLQPNRPPCFSSIRPCMVPLKDLVTSQIPHG